ncbi:hypothetical protein RSAG8_13029, partial [Rhizoctonia solani AG-8 WAC10335]
MTSQKDFIEILVFPDATHSPLTTGVLATTGGSLSKSKGKTKLAPMIKLPKPRGKVNHKASGPAAIQKFSQDKIHDSAVSKFTTPPPLTFKEPQFQANKNSSKHQASSEAVAGTKCHKGDKDVSNGKGGESSTVDGVASSDTGHPKRKHIPSASGFLATAG